MCLRFYYFRIYLSMEFYFRKCYEMKLMRFTCSVIKIRNGLWTWLSLLHHSLECPWLSLLMRITGDYTACSCALFTCRLFKWKQSHTGLQGCNLITCWGDKNIFDIVKVQSKQQQIMFNIQVTQEVHMLQHMSTYVLE